MSHNFDEANSLNDVAEFHDLFDLPVIVNPSIPSKERCDLRVNLIEEELNELKEAIITNDIVEVADALADLQYVLSGAVLEFGLADKFKELFDSVHHSNMSKACKSMEEALETQAYYEKAKNTQSFIQQKGELFLVYRASDRKVLKSINYLQVNLQSLLNI